MIWPENQPQARRQHGLDADRPRFRLGGRHRLGLDILRIVIGYHDIDDPFGERFDKGQPLFFAAQWG